VPSILRNSRYRRDQRQLEEEEEMWFNEDDDYDDGPSVHKSPTTPPPFADEIFSKKIDSNLESIGGKTLLAFKLGLYSAQCITLHKKSQGFRFGVYTVPQHIIFNQ